MPRKRKLGDLSRRCRFCLKNDPCMTELFSDELKSIVEDVTKSTGIEVQNTPYYPKNICHVCLYKLNTWDELKSQFTKSHQTLLLRFDVVETNKTQVNKVQNDLITAENNTENHKRQIKKADNLAEETSTQTVKKRAKLDLETMEPKVSLHNKTNEEKASETSLNNSQPLSDGAISSPTVTRKKQRKAATKRWVERKNAALVANGELPSESDSDTGSQKLTPTKKAKNESEKQLSKLRRLQKTLAIDATEKMGGLEGNSARRTRGVKKGPEAKPIPKKSPVKQIEKDNFKKESSEKKEKENEKSTVEEVNSDVKVAERKTVSKGAKEDETKSHLADEAVEQITSEKIEEKVQDVCENTQATSPSKDLEKLNFKVKSTVETIFMEEEALSQDETQETAGDSMLDFETAPESDIEMPLPTPPPKKSKPGPASSKLSNKQPATVLKTVENSNLSELKSNAISIMTTNKDPVEDVEIIKEQMLPKSQQLFEPQTVTVRAKLGRATYILTTTLDLPGFSSTNDIDTKSCINADPSSRDDKNNLMNAMQLQRVKNEEILPFMNLQDNLETQKCLKIEVEGLEPEALQRVQLCLANFLTEDAQKLMQKPLNHKPVTKGKFKDSYDSLEFQLRNIVEKVLRSNYQSEKTADLNSKKIETEVKQSPVKKLVTSGMNNNKTSDTILSPKKNVNKSLEGEKTPNKIEIEGESIDTQSIESEQETLDSPKKKDGLYQPKVKLNKMNLTELKSMYAINNLQVLENEKTNQNIPIVNVSRTMGKRKLVLPKKYDDFSLDLKPVSDEESRKSKKPISGEENKKEVTLETNLKKPVNNIVNIPSEEALANEVSDDDDDYMPNDEEIGEDDSDPEKDTTHNLPAISTEVINTTPVVSKITLATKKLPAKQPVASKSSLQKPLPSLAGIARKVEPPSKSSANLSFGKRQRHICGICGKEMPTKAEAERHVQEHKLGHNISMPKSAAQPITHSKSKNDSPKKIASTGMTKQGLFKMNHTSKSIISDEESYKKPQMQQPKAKLMRCKRCQAIVEAKNVKTHVCNSKKFDCNLCECTFGAEHLLAAHLDTHRERAAAIEAQNKAAEQENEGLHYAEESNFNSEEQDSQGYSCFVCDKVFKDEDEMRNHLGMHCEENSEDQNERGFQCAFCGEKFENEEILESHVGNHLLDNEDEKINMMINSEGRRVMKNKCIYKCELCYEEFTKIDTLKMHMATHDEDEEESRNATTEMEDDFVCNVCDEVFDSQEDLIEHQDIHDGITHVCILCEKPFSSIKELQDHVSTHL